MHSISVIIPVYRSELILHNLYDQLIPAMEKITQEFEVIMVEDNGGDRSWEIIEELTGKNHRVRGIKLCRNYEQH